MIKCWLQPGMVTCNRREAGEAGCRYKLYQSLGRFRITLYFFYTMTLSYQLDQNDFLQHQLFLASKTGRIKKQRTISRLIVSGSMLVLSFLFYQSGNSVLFYYFLGVGILAIFFYPLYQRRRYKDHYARAIADTYKNRFGQTANIKFTDLAIETNDSTGESKINLSELDNITETGDHFFLRLKTGVCLIIPKSKIGDLTQLETELKQLCQKLDIDFVKELDWKWK